MKVEQVMNREPVVVDPDLSYKDLVELLLHRQIGGVVVVDGEGHVVGVVSEADLVSKEAYGGPRPRTLSLLADVLSGRPEHWLSKAGGWTARSVMSRHVVSCRPDDDVRSAARSMLRERVGRLPVIDDEGTLLGTVSQRDLLRVFDRSDEQIAADVDRMVADGQSLPDDCHVHAEVHQGIVTLRGDVRYEWDLAAVASAVRLVRGVIDVDSELHAREPNPRPVPPVMFG